MTARIRVKADRIISEYEKFKEDSVNALKLEIAHNDLLLKRRRLNEELFRLRYKDRYFYSITDAWMREKRTSNSMNGLRELSEIASKSDDGFVEIDSDMSSFINMKFNFNYIENDIKDGIKQVEKMISDIETEIDVLKKIAPPSVDLTKQTIMEPVKTSASDFWYPCIGAVLIIGLLAVIFGAL